MDNETHEEQTMTEAIKQEGIRRALLSGPSCVTNAATVAEMDRVGQLTVLRPGTNADRAALDERPPPGRGDE
jgi:hypothetical protein